MPGRRARFEHLDDEHAATAAGAWGSKHARLVRRRLGRLRLSLVHVKVLARLFRGKVLAMLRKHWQFRLYPYNS